MDGLTALRCVENVLQITYIDFKTKYVCKSFLQFGIVTLVTYFSNLFFVILHTFVASVLILESIDMLLAGPPKPVRSKMREEAKNNPRRRELR
jgi:hypothetical protein